MKRIDAIVLAVLVSVFVLPAHAALKIFATVPEWGALAQEIGGEQVKVYTATHGLQNPHRIDAKPSLIAQARSAQLVVATGAELEVGCRWSSANPATRAFSLASPVSLRRRAT